MRKLVLEIATTDYASTAMAVQAGADRIELCSALSEGGITPSYGTIKQVVEKFSIPIFPIIRPRGGDFLYSYDEFRAMLHDIEVCRSMGCRGVVGGVLLASGEIDVNRTGKLVAAAYPMEFTFHRAFDRCKDPFAALEQLIALGCQRILTSGQRPAAPDAWETIRQLVQASGERIIIMPGSGIRSGNLQEGIDKTGAVEFHSSARSMTPGQMQFRHPAFNPADGAYASADADEIAAMRQILDGNN